MIELDIDASGAIATEAVARAPAPASRAAPELHTPEGKPGRCWSRSPDPSAPEAAVSAGFTGLVDAHFDAELQPVLANHHGLHPDIAT